MMNLAMLKTIWNKGIWTLFLPIFQKQHPDIRLIPLDCVTYLNDQRFSSCHHKYDTIFFYQLQKCQIPWTTLPMSFNLFNISMHIAQKWHTTHTFLFRPAIYRPMPEKVDAFFAWLGTLQRFGAISLVRLGIMVPWFLIYYTYTKLFHNFDNLKLYSIFDFSDR